MTWKDILKQKIPTQQPQGFPIEGKIHVYDPNIGDSDSYWLTFYSNDWDDGLEIRKRENSQFQKEVVEKHPNSPLVAFFNKFAKFRRRVSKPDDKYDFDITDIQMIKEPKPQEIKSVAKSMGLKLHINPTNIDEDEY
jgi:hypothetical protein|tara:strand:+ start:369 stop:779 length:411 start_codon:yes stop_codon:yes gene_type:complete